MRAAVLIVLSLSALAYAGPALNNQIETANRVNQQQQYMTAGQQQQHFKQTPATETLKQWCFSSKMSQPELTASFKKLVEIVRSSQDEQATEQAVMNERICQSIQTSEDSVEVDPQAHELIKDVYMDALLNADSHQTTQQLLKIVKSDQVDTIRASYYMTRIAVSNKESIKDAAQVEQLAESYLNEKFESTSEIVERQKLFAVTATLGKLLEKETRNEKLEKLAAEVAKTIVERNIRPINQQEIQQYKEQPEQQSAELTKKVASRSAALKALSNIPSYVIKSCEGVQQILVKIAQNKHELSTARQSAIECLEQNEKVLKEIQEIAFNQEEPVEVRIAAYRAVISSLFAGNQKDEQAKQQTATDVIQQLMRHAEESRNQQQDDQFVMYVVSHLNNLRTSSKPEDKQLREIITKNKQHNMQIQLLSKKFKQQQKGGLIEKSSRNIQLSQQFQQLKSGFVLSGDLIYESANKQQVSILPKLVRMNMSMPVMGETVGVLELTFRQNQMDESLVSALKIAQKGQFSAESMNKIIDSLKDSKKHQQQTESAELDACIKYENMVIFYMSMDDLKSQAEGLKRSTRSTGSYGMLSGSPVGELVGELIEFLKKNPISFNRGFNFNINDKLAKVLDVDASILAGLRFESRARGSVDDKLELVATIEPRFMYEGIYGTIESGNKKLMQRVSTKTAFGMRLNFVKDQLVDLQLDLPLDTMDLFSVENQIVDKTPKGYSYTLDSIYGQESIYAADEDQYEKYQTGRVPIVRQGGIRKMKRNIFENINTNTNRYSKNSNKNTGMWFGKRAASVLASDYALELEVPQEIVRATGLGGRLRVYASPKDLTYILQASLHKFERQMQGVRFQVKKEQKSGQQMSLIVSTPGSTIDRTTELVYQRQEGKQSSVVSVSIKSPIVGTVLAKTELVYEPTKYALKSMLVAGEQRHSAELGFVRVTGGPQSQGPIFKTYANVVSSALAQPVQMQGLLKVQQQSQQQLPLVTFELKSATFPANFLQGKVAFEHKNEQRVSHRRSMQSPVELLLAGDLAINTELSGQIFGETIKVRNMIEKRAVPSAGLTVELAVSHKAQKASADNQILVNLKLDQEQQMITVQRKFAEWARARNFRMTVGSDCRGDNLHKMLVELRKGQNFEQIYAYKHKLAYLFPVQRAARSQLDYAIELQASPYSFVEKIAGSAKLQLAGPEKAVESKVQIGERAMVELSARFAGFERSQAELSVKSKRVQHSTSMKCDSSVVYLRSQTQEQGEIVAKVVMELEREQELARILVEVPAENLRLAGDLKYSHGDIVLTSSFKGQRYTSGAELNLNRFARGAKKSPAGYFQMPESVRAKAYLKDMMNEEAYWLDSSVAAADSDKWFLRASSPLYRADLEWSPREQQAKLATYGRISKPQNSLNQLYSVQDSLLKQDFEKKLSLDANKLWMARSLLSSPFARNQLAKSIRRALFEYADRRQSHKHQVEMSPQQERVAFNLERLVQGAKPYRVSGDFDLAAIDYFSAKHNDGTTTTSFNDDGTTTTSFNDDGTTTTTTFNDQRQPRPASFLRMSAGDLFDLDMNSALPSQGQTGYVKLSALSRHPRSPFKKHESEFRFGQNKGYKGWAKHQDAKNKHHELQFESDAAPSKWSKLSVDSEQHGKLNFEHKWRQQRNKRSVAGSQQQEELEHQLWGGIRYQARDQQEPMDYSLDLAYQPQSHYNLKLAMPEHMEHESRLEYQPRDRVYKLNSKLYNRHTKLPSYQIDAQADELLFTSPMAMRKPTYFRFNDFTGRQCHLNLDQEDSRQARSTLFYKDPIYNIEHSSEYTYQPNMLFRDTFLGVPVNFETKSNTRFGPVKVRVHSDSKTSQLELESPLVEAELKKVADEVLDILKLTIGNSKKSARAVKIVRDIPILNQIELVQRAAKLLDQNTFHHDTELVMDQRKNAFKVKSDTMMNGEQAMSVDGELVRGDNKAVIKVTGKRVNGYIAVDTVRQSARIVLESNDKRGIQHQTKIERQGNFFEVQSITTKHQKPIYQVTGKIAHQQETNFINVDIEIIPSNGRQYFSRGQIDMNGIMYPTKFYGDAHLSKVIINQPQSNQIWSFKYSPAKYFAYKSPNAAQEFIQPISVM